MEESVKDKNKSILKIVFNVIIDILLVLFIACAAFVLVINITSKKDSDGTATIFNTQLRLVASDSMAQCDETDVSKFEIKSIPIKSCVFVETIPTDETKKQEWLSNIKVGDVLTFRYTYTKQETITHRVVSIEPKTGGYIFTLAGDNKSSDSGVLKQVIDTTLVDSPNYIVGKVKGQSYFLGLIIYALRSTWGTVFFIVIPCLIIITVSVVRIVKVIMVEKKEKSLEQVKSQSQEIEELRKQIELLQKEKTNAKSEDE